MKIATNTLLTVLLGLGMTISCKPSTSSETKTAPLFVKAGTLESLDGKTVYGGPELNAPLSSTGSQANSSKSLQDVFSSLPDAGRTENQIAADAIKLSWDLQDNYKAANPSYMSQFAQNQLQQANDNAANATYTPSYISQFAQNQLQQASDNAANATYPSYNNSSANAVSVLEYTPSYDHNAWANAEQARLNQLYPSNDAINNVNLGSVNNPLNSSSQVQGSAGGTPAWAPTGSVKCHNSAGYTQPQFASAC